MEGSRCAALLNLRISCVGSLAAYKKAVSLAREAHSKERAKRLKAAIRKYKAEGGTLLQNGHVLSQNGAEQVFPSSRPRSDMHIL